MEPQTKQRADAIIPTNDMFLLKPYRLLNWSSRATESGEERATGWAKSKTICGLECAYDRSGAHWWLWK